MGGTGKLCSPVLGSEDGQREESSNFSEAVDESDLLRRLFWFEAVKKKTHASKASMQHHSITVTYLLFGG